MTSRTEYQGYVFTDVTTRTDDGRYRARVAIASLEGTRTRSQRFIDLEVFATEAEAAERIEAVARAWVDDEVATDKLSLPTNFSEFR